MAQDATTEPEPIDRADLIGQDPATHRLLSFCFVSNFSPDWNAGAAGSILAIGKALEHAGHSVRYRWRESNSSKFQHTTLNNLVGLPRTQYRQVKAELSSGPPDVVIVSQPFAYTVFEKLGKGFPRTVFLNLTHGWEHRLDIAKRDLNWRDSSPESHRVMSRLATAARARVCRRTALAMDGLLSPCSRDGRFVMSQYGVPERKVLFMTYGLDESFFGELPSRTAARGLRMLFFGQYVPRKGSLVLQRILPQLGHEFPTAELTFIIPKQQQGAIEQAYRGAFGERLHVYEWMSRNEVIKICCQNDVFLFPSMLEGFGKTFLEAMACGVCVVGYGEGGLPDVAENGVEALYCDPGDEKEFQRLLRGCLADPGIARRIAPKARSKALRFTWQKTAEALETFSRDLLRRKQALNA